MTACNIPKLVVAALLLSAITPTGYLYAQEPPQPDFYTLGLSATPGESAEEILIRAHNGDTQAMALAAVGYDLGANGFLRDKLMALCWGGAAGDWRARNMEALLRAYVLRDRKIANESDRTLTTVCCAAGRKSPFAALLKNAGLFDVESRLAEASIKESQLSAEDEKIYQSLMKSAESSPQEEAENIARCRATSMVGPVDAELEKNLDYTNCGYPSYLLFFAATTHDPESQSPDWQPERLFSFMEQRRKGGSFRSEAEAAREISAKLTYDPGPDLELIRKAHAGDIIAMRTLAGKYLAKEMGVLEDPIIAHVWFELAAYKGDAISMFALANDPIKDNPLFTWAWASLAKQYGDARMQVLAGQLLRQVESRASPYMMVLACRALREFGGKISLGTAPQPGREQK